jgi:hypothetical protein
MALKGFSDVFKKLNDSVYGDLFVKKEDLFTRAGIARVFSEILFRATGEKFVFIMEEEIRTYPDDSLETSIYRDRYCKEQQCIVVKNYQKYAHNVLPEYSNLVVTKLFAVDSEGTNTFKIGLLLYYHNQDVLEIDQEDIKKKIAFWQFFAKIVFVDNSPAAVAHRYKHQLKDSLTRILELLSLVGKNEKTFDEVDPEIRKTVAMIKRKMDYLGSSSLVMQNLRTSRAVKIGAEVKKIITEEFPRQLDPKALSCIEYHGPATDVELALSVEGLEEALFNMVKNAYEAKATKISIKVGYDASKQRVNIAVRDNGRGMSAENMSKLLEGVNFTTKTKGTGRYFAEIVLGFLQSCKGELSGASIEYQESAASNEFCGTHLTMSIPLHPEAYTMEDLEPLAASVLEEEQLLMLHSLVQKKSSQEIPLFAETALWVFDTQREVLIQRHNTLTPDNSIAQIDSAQIKVFTRAIFKIHPGNMVFLSEDSLPSHENVPLNIFFPGQGNVFCFLKIRQQIYIFRGTLAVEMYTKSIQSLQQDLDQELSALDYYLSRIKLLTDFYQSSTPLKDFLLTQPRSFFLFHDDQSIYHEFARSAFRLVQEGKDKFIEYEI